MRSSLRVGIALVLVTLWSVGISWAQDGLTKQDRQGPVTVTVTPTPSPAAGTPLKVKVVLDTHSVALDVVKFEQAVVLRPAEGADIPPTGVEQVSGGGHHRAAVLVFPSLALTGPLRIVVKNVGGVAERSFAWELTPAR